MIIVIISYLYYKLDLFYPSCALLNFLFNLCDLLKIDLCLENQDQIEALNFFKKNYHIGPNIELVL